MANFSFQRDAVTTVGEAFADGSTLDLVSPSPGRLALLLRRGGKTRIAAQIAHSGRIYKPPDVNEATARAIRFPHTAKSCGSTRKVLCRIKELFKQYAGLAQAESWLMAAWTATSWFADVLSSPPALLISGPEIEHGIRILRLLQSLCRRPVLLADINRSAFLALAPLGTTFLVNQPELSHTIRALWDTSNYRGVHVFGNGKVNSVSVSKAVFVGMAHERKGEGFHFALTPTNHDMPPLDEETLCGIAHELQPQLLDYRLRNIRAVRSFSTRDRRSTDRSTEIAFSLEACVLGEAEIMESIAPLLRHFEQESIEERGWDVHVAIIEVAWTPSHADREIAIARLTDLTNALLRSRGETLEYSPAEIGWKLRSFGFRRHRSARGMAMQFSQENRLLLHRLAARLGLNLPSISECRLCPGEAIDSEQLV